MSLLRLLLRTTIPIGKSMAYPNSPHQTRLIFSPVVNPNQHQNMSSSTYTSTPLSKPVATITSLDHLVLTVKNIEKTKEWYTKNLGMRHEAFVSASTPDITRHSLIFGSQKINLHESGHEFEPKALNVQPGSGDLCFLTSDPISEVRKRLIEAGVEMVDLGGEGNDLGFGEGIVKRTGARGTLASVYCRDLDGNLVEISNYV